MDNDQEKAADEAFCASCRAVIKKDAEICPHCGVRQKRQNSEVSVSGEAFCASCGAVIKKDAEICPHCGVRQKRQNSEVSAKWLTLMLLSLFLGELGVDRFYVGKIGTGILKLLTLGGCGVWWLIDLILILSGKFTDEHGNVIRKE
jgi:TM2 domain-containing membrane protein YozV